jgi:hypothetical protein
VAAQVLVKLDADLNRVRQQVIQLLHGHQAEEPASAGSAARELRLLPAVNARLEAVEQRLTAIEQRIGIGSDSSDLDEQIETVRTDKEAAVDAHDYAQAALLISSPEVAALLYKLDGQLDSLTQRAVTKQWTLVEFRQERGSLGQLGADYLDAARAETGWPPLRLKSLWEWDQAVAAELAAEPSKAAP